ncbi:hypothetical protein Agub_g7768, partial [Astrephomene gubernaculifera]
MAQHLLRRPVRGLQASTSLQCPAQTIRIHRPCIIGKLRTLPVLCPSKLALPVYQPRHARVVPNVAYEEDADTTVDEEFTDPLGRKRSRLEIDTSPEVIEGQDAVELPMPCEYQQTLWSSFCLGGIGLHSGEYAVVRVRPAFAGEGRYFVRVEDGTNAHLANAAISLDPPLDGTSDLSPEEQAEQADPEYRQELVMRYMEFVDAQETERFPGSFLDYLERQSCTDIVERLKTEGPPRFQFSAPEAPAPRRDEEEGPLLALAANLYDPNPVTTSLANDYFQVFGAETLLSALEACGVDNARIEIEGGAEVPILDGSAEGWVAHIVVAGLRYAPSRPDLQVPGPVKSSRQADAEAGEG